MPDGVGVGSAVEVEDDVAVGGYPVLGVVVALLQKQMRTGRPEAVAADHVPVRAEPVLFHIRLGHDIEDEEPAGTECLEGAFEKPVAPPVGDSGHPAVDEKDHVVAVLQLVPKRLTGCHIVSVYEGGRQSQALCERSTVAPGVLDGRRSYVDPGDRASLFQERLGVEPRPASEVEYVGGEPVLASSLLQHPVELPDTLLRRSGRRIDCLVQMRIEDVPADIRVGPEDSLFVLEGLRPFEKLVQLFTVDVYSVGKVSHQYVTTSFGNRSYITKRLGEKELSEAAALIRQGECVVFPTETVYGLGADAGSESAVQKIFWAKGRPADNPLIVHVARIEDVAAVARVGDAARRLLGAFTPGPLTAVLPAEDGVAPGVRAGLDTVAVRIPAHPLALRLIDAAGVAIAAPSANRSGRPSPTDAEMAFREMAGRVAAVLDGGECAVGLESTVVRVDETEVVLLRPGAVSAFDLGRVSGLPVRSAEAPEAGSSPGTRYRHYAPSVPVVAVESEAELRAAVSRQAEALVLHVASTAAGVAAGEAGYFASAGPSEPGEAGSGVVWARYESYAELARSLYRRIIEAESDGVPIVVRIPDAATCRADGTAAALRDRVLRAARR